MQLRDYQLDCINSVHGAFNIHSRVLGTMATGGGKTTVFSILANHASRRFGSFEGGSGKTLILVNRKQLLRQTAIELKKVTGMVAALEQGEHTAPLEATCVVASVDSLANRLEKYPKDHFEFMVIDEAHLMTGKRARRVMDHFDCRKLGVTATPHNKGKKALSKFYDHVAFDIPLLRLIKEGYLCPITVAMSPLKIDISTVSTKLGDLEVEGLATSITPYFDAIAMEMLKYPHRKWLCFLPVIQSSKDFASVLTKHGFRSCHVDGVTDNTVALEQFRLGQLDVLTCSQLLYFGYNEPSIDGIVNLRQTKSVNFYEQLIGRGTRKSESTLKHELLVLDFLWQYADMGLVRPAFVLTKDDAEAEALQRRVLSSQSPIDLVSALDAVKRDIYTSLQEKLKENAKKKKRLISIGDVVAETPLANFQSEFFPYPPSAAQLAVLARHGIDVDEIKDKKMASQLIDWLHDRIEKGLASQKQLALLRRMGIKADNETTFDRASWLLDQRLGKKDYVRK